MSLEVTDSRPIEVADKRRLPVMLDRDALDLLPTPHHVCLYAVLCALAGSECRTAPGLRQLAKRAKMGHTRAAEVLRDLEEMGAISRHRTVSQRSGMQTRTVYSIHGFEAVRVADTPPRTDAVAAVRVAEHVREAEAIREADRLTNGSVRQPDSNDTNNEVVLSQQDLGLVQELTRAGVAETVAQQLVVELPGECIRQLKLIDQRANVRDRAATLVKSIREAWSAPVDPSPTRPNTAQAGTKPPTFGPAMFGIPAVSEPPECRTCDTTGWIDAPGTNNTMTACPSCRPVPQLATSATMGR